MLLSAGLLLYTLTTQPADAQVLRGRIIDDATTSGIAAAVVEIVDAGNRVVARLLSDSTGAFVLTLPAAGEYSLRVERLGFHTFVSIPFRVAADLAMVEEFRIQPQAIAIPAVEVRATSRCTGQERTAAAYMFWEEARKALALTLFTAFDEGITYGVKQYTRRLAANQRLVKQDSQFTSLRARGGPFASIPIDSLLRRGFVQPAPQGRGWLYFAPDATVLLAEEFRAGYCFRTTTNRRQRGLIGLDFEPIGPEEVPGIEGTLWLDAASTELRFLEFSFTRVPFRVPVPGGGRLDFQKLESGAWIVNRWSMRVPVLRDADNQVPIRVVSLDGYLETVRVLTSAIGHDGRELLPPRR